MLRKTLLHLRQVQTRRFEMRGDFAVKAILVRRGLVEDQRLQCVLPSLAE